MRAMILRCLLLLLAAALWPAIASAAPVPAKDDAETLPPMTFFVAKGEPDSCGPGCNEWIAADGRIKEDTAQKFGKFLRTLGKRKLPIYFHSPGGSVSAGVAIGRMLRARGMTAGVARTIPEGCDPVKEREAACDALKREGRELQSELRTARTMCNSSCVYALIGATVREVPAGSRLGVHTMALVEKPNRKISASEEQRQLEAANARLARYIGEMKIAPGLFEAASKVRFERLRFLSRDEIAQFGIDKRDFHESRWMVDEGPPGPLMVVKFIVEAKGGETKRYHTTRIRLACTRSPGTIFFEFGRELGPADRWDASMAVTLGSGDFVLPPGRGKPVVGYNDVQMESRLTRVALGLFEEATGRKTMSILEAPAAVADASAPMALRPPLKLSTDGLTSAIAALGKRCR